MRGSAWCGCEGAGGRLPPSVQRPPRPTGFSTRSLPPVPSRAPDALSVTAPARAPLVPTPLPESDASRYPTRARLGQLAGCPVRFDDTHPFARPSRSRLALSRPMAGPLSPRAHGSRVSSRGLLGRLGVWRVFALLGPHAVGVHPSETTPALRYPRALARGPARTMRLGVGHVGVVRALPLALLSRPEPPLAGCASFAGPPDDRIHNGPPRAGARGGPGFWGGACFG